jgi:DNA-binding protein H-NS
MDEETIKKQKQAKQAQEQKKAKQAKQAKQEQIVDQFQALMDEETIKKQKQAKQAQEQKKVDQFPVRTQKQPLIINNRVNTGGGRGGYNLHINKLMDEFRDRLPYY